MHHRQRSCSQIWTVVAATLFTLTLSASDMALLVGEVHEDWYDEDKLEADVDTIIVETAGQFASVRTFDHAGIEQLQVWVEANLRDGELDIIWLNGSMPRFLWPKGQPKTLARQWLDTGNMFINVGQPFAQQSWECDGGCEENGPQAAADILGLSPDLFVSINDVVKVGGPALNIKRTATGTEFMPRLCRRPLTSIVMATAEVDGDWTVAAAFATWKGDEPGEVADPIVIRNRRTNGYLCIISQTLGPRRCERGEATADFINNWVIKNAVGFGVAAAGKLPAKWGAIKSRSM